MFFLTSGPSLQVHIPLSFKNTKRQKLTQEELIGKIEGYLMKVKRTDYNYILQETGKRHKKATKSNDSFLSLCRSLPPQFFLPHIGSISTSSHESALLLSDSASSTFPYILTKHGHQRLFHDSHLQAHQPVNQHLAVYSHSQWMGKEVSLSQLSQWTISCWTHLPSSGQGREDHQIQCLSFCTGIPVMLWRRQSHSRLPTLAPSQNFLWLHHLVLSSLWAPASPVGDSLRSFLLSIFPLHVSSSNRSLHHPRTQTQTKPCVVTHPPYLDIVPRNRLVGVTAPEIWNNVSW